MKYTWILFNASAVPLSLFRSSLSNIRELDKGQGVSLECPDVLNTDEDMSMSIYKSLIFQGKPRKRDKGATRGTGRVPV